MAKRRRMQVMLNLRMSTCAYCHAAEHSIDLKGRGALRDLWAGPVRPPSPTHPDERRTSLDTVADISADVDMRARIDRYVRIYASVSMGFGCKRMRYQSKSVLALKHKNTVRGSPVHFNFWTSSCLLCVPSTHALKQTLRPSHTGLNPPNLLQRSC